MAEKTVAQLKEHADLIGVTYNSKIKKADLIDLIDQREKEIVAAGQVEIDNARTERETAKQATSKLMYVHYRGRAMGAKHYGFGVGSNNYHGMRKVYNESTHMPNSERVRKYARTNSPWVGIGAHRNHVPKLTPRQMRRVLKHAGKHGENFVIGPVVPGDQHPYNREYSLLALTPEGLGIFHKLDA